MWGGGGENLVSGGGRGKGGAPPPPPPHSESAFPIHCIPSRGVLMNPALKARSLLVRYSRYLFLISEHEFLVGGGPAEVGGRERNWFFGGLISGIWEMGRLAIWAEGGDVGGVVWGVGGFDGWEGLMGRGLGG